MTSVSIEAEVKKGPRLRCPVYGKYVHQSRMVLDNLGRLVFKKAIRFVNTWPTDIQMKPALNTDDFVTSQPEKGTGLEEIITSHSGERLTWN